MPRGRMLSRKISRDEKVASLSIHATLLFTWMIPHTDCEGRMFALPETIKGNVCPMLKYFTLSKIKSCLIEIESAELINIYGEGKYLQFNGFQKNQNINKDRESPSEIPSPDLLKSNSRVTQEQKISIYFKDKVKDKDKDNNTTHDIFSFDEIYNKYPRRIEKHSAYKHFKATVKTQEDYTNINKAITNYLKYIQDNKTELKFIKHASSWFNQWRDWIDVDISKQPRKF